MDYAVLRSVADSIITGFSNGQVAILLRGVENKDPKTGKIEKTYEQVTGGLAVMTNYTAEAIAASGGLINAGDVKFVCNFTEKPTETKDRIRYANVDYNIIHCRPVDPTGEYVVTYVIQGRKA